MTEFFTSTEVVEQQSELPSFVYRDKKIIEHLSKLDLSGKILDIGERSKMTQRMEDALNIECDNTDGDLDAPWHYSSLRPEYDIIIFSHVIEHLFNPLSCLEGLKRMMNPDALLIICTPIKPHFLPWGKGHFHEMDDYRFRKLIERAGLRIVRWEKWRNGPMFCDLGIRPILRKLFFKEQSFVVCKL